MKPWQLWKNYFWTNFTMKPKSKSPHQVIKGLGVSPGYGIGPAKIISPEELSAPRRYIARNAVDKEITRFKRAIDKATKEIASVKRRMKKVVGEYESKIFDAHVMILNDPEIVDHVIKDIRTNYRNAEFAYLNRINEFEARLKPLTDQYFQDRINEAKSVAKKVIEILQKTSQQHSLVAELDTPSIHFTLEMTPFALGKSDKKNTIGFVTEKGGNTSHVSILARSMEVPAISGIDYQRFEISEGDMVILDGTEGLLIIQPTAREIAEYETKKARYFDLERKLFEVRNLESKTKDKKSIELSANIELPVEVDKVLLYGGSSIGLYRSEFLFLTHKEIPSEEEQYQTYRYIGDRMSPGSVVIRTFDSGGDKLFPQVNLKDESNPFMGWRSIRVCLKEPEIFKTQLRAILRASYNNNIKLMFPMITSLDELLESKAILKDVQKEFDSNKVPYNKNIKVGCMIEVPAAVMIADELAEHCDFFSMGTNDLIQFTLAVDRGNKMVADLYEPHHPAVLRLIQTTIKAAKRKKIPVSICGEMAGNPYSALLLMGLGVQELSMRPNSILEMKKFIRSLSYSEIRKDVAEALSMSNATQITTFLENRYSKVIQSMQFPPHEPSSR